MTDEELLSEIYKYFPRVSLSTEFIQQADGTITHQFMVVRCGDLGFRSAPQRLEFPMIPIYPTLDEKEIN